MLAEFVCKAAQFFLFDEELLAGFNPFGMIDDWMRSDARVVTFIESELD